MRWGVSIGLAAAVLGASCSSPQAGVKVRAVSGGAVSGGVAEAEAQLALGNVGLALQGFRNTLRERPGDVRAITGIARSYAQMGRFDLVQRWYESALAAEPGNTALLRQLAEALEAQGLNERAALIRSEAAERDARALAGATQVQANSQFQAPPLGEPSSSVTVALPPAQPPNAQAPPSEMISSPQVSQPEPAFAAAGYPAPRLERLSLGEVALVTRSEPVWKSVLVERSPKSATYRFVAERPVARLLNAARVEGLAARTRARLVARGWARIEIGDAPAIREKTIVLFPPTQHVSARRLAAQFGFRRLLPFEGPQIVVLLGRDAAQLRSLRPA